MKLKLAIFIGIGIMAISAGIGLTLSTRQASAEAFAENFSAHGLAAVHGDMSGTYDFDPNHTAVGFRAKHMGLIDVPGYFRDITGSIVYDGKDVSKSSVEFTAKTTSIDTGVDRRDNHLRTKDFFEVETYPEMKFKSTKIEKKGDDWLVTGNLTIKDVTKQVTFPFHVVGFVEQTGGTKMGATAQTTINRRDFNVNWGGNLPNGSAMVSDDIKVDLQVEAVLQKKEEAAADKK